MTELLTDPARPIGGLPASVPADRLLAGFDTEHEPSADVPPTDVPPTQRERDAQWMASAADTPDMASLSLADLRVMANRTFRLLDSDHPPVHASDRYSAAVTEIELRARRSAARGGAGVRDVFKDSPYNSRFELYLDGSLAAYIKYSLLGGHLTLRALVELPGFEGRGLERVLMRRAVLNAHKRRLTVVPACPVADTFLDRNPQYRTLARMPGRLPPAAASVPRG
ncbi:GNAT family N-acetyltransferase [Arthrobacter sp. NPDC092385]|uniref:GNAT family N-acetyltransferase n=1 Tax=Arthrobacter sp. NPDC092385 TaxID=3363943 RepID=UPI0037F2436D